MKKEVYFGIAWRIVLMCFVGMFMSYLTPALRDFLGDELYNPEYYHHDWVDDDYVWGARHYWYWWMMVGLFLLSLVNSIIGVVKLVEEHYDL